MAILKRTAGNKSMGFNLRAPIGPHEHPSALMSTHKQPRAAMSVPDYN